MTVCNCVAFHNLKFDKPEFREQFFDKRNTDCRLRAFVREAVDNFPGYDWVITSARRKPEHVGSGHNYKILSAFDLRSRTWTVPQLIAFHDWCNRWWTTKPDLIDVIIEDGRFDKSYEGYAPHIHIEIAEKKYWK